MKLSDETLMAYVDGELDAAARKAVETAMAEDPEVKRQVQRQQALRVKLRAAFDRVLDEPVPQRLIDAARTSPTARSDSSVADLASARLARAEKAPPARRHWALPEWAAIAASLVIGVFVGQAVLRSPDAGMLATREGRVVARGALAEALTEQLASTQADDAAVRIGTSFKDVAGDYCRTFELREGGALAGLACRADEDWDVKVLAPGVAGDANAGTYRMAGAPLPEAVFRAVEARIVGEPLDAESETQAQREGWR